jgi:hypothetical protein
MTAERPAAATGAARVARFDASLAARVGPLRPLRYQDGAQEAADLPGHVRAASGVRRLGDALAIVQDDTNAVALRGADGALRPLLLPRGAGGRRQFGERLGNKRAKLDLEAAAALPDGRLVLFGSGSARARRRLVVVDPDGAVRQLSGASLYRHLSRRPDFCGSELNVEGAVVVGDRLRLFQRGNGAPRGALQPRDATGDLDLAAFVAWIDGLGPTPRLLDVRGYALGEAEGVRLTFTDAAALPDGRVAYLAAAEASPNTYDDGEVRGCAVGVIDGDDVRSALITDAEGAPCRTKLEGLEWLDGDADTARFYVVADLDDEQAPALGGVLEVQRNTADAAPVVAR